MPIFHFKLLLKIAIFFAKNDSWLQIFLSPNQIFSIAERLSYKCKGTHTLDPCKLFTTKCSKSLLFSRQISVPRITHRYAWIIPSKSSVCLQNSGKKTCDSQCSTDKLILTHDHWQSHDKKKLIFRMKIKLEFTWEFTESHKHVFTTR